MEWTSMIETALGVILGAIVSILSIALHDRIKDQVSSKKAKSRLYDELKLIQCVFRSIRTAIPASFGQAFRCRPDKLILTSHDFLFT